MLVTPSPKERCRNGGSEEKLTRMIKGMENLYEEISKRQIISSKTVTSGSVEKKKYIKWATEERVKLLFCLLPSTRTKTFSYIKYIRQKTNRGKAICIIQLRHATLFLQNVVDAQVFSRNLKNQRST